MAKNHGEGKQRRQKAKQRLKIAWRSSIKEARRNKHR